MKFTEDLQKEIDFMLVLAEHDYPSVPKNEVFSFHNRE